MQIVIICVCKQLLLTFANNTHLPRLTSDLEEYIVSDCQNRREASLAEKPMEMAPDSPEPILGYNVGEPSITPTVYNNSRLMST
jgi:hypothetical protein